MRWITRALRLTTKRASLLTAMGSHGNVVCPALFSPSRLLHLRQAICCFGERVLCRFFWIYRPAGQCSSTPVTGARRMTSRGCNAGRPRHGLGRPRWPTKRQHARTPRQEVSGTTFGGGSWPRTLNRLMPVTGRRSPLTLKKGLRLPVPGRLHVRPGARPGRDVGTRSRNSGSGRMSGRQAHLWTPQGVLRHGRHLTGGRDGHCMDSFDANRRSPNGIPVTRAVERQVIISITPKLGSRIVFAGSTWIGSFTTITSGATVDVGDSGVPASAIAAGLEATSGPSSCSPAGGAFRFGLGM